MRFLALLLVLAPGVAAAQYRPSFGQQRDTLLSFCRAVRGMVYTESAGVFQLSDSLRGIVLRHLPPDSLGHRRVAVIETSPPTTPVECRRRMGK